MVRNEKPAKGGSYIRRKDGTLHRLTSAEQDALHRKAGYKPFPEAVEETLSDQRFSAAAVFDRIKEALGCDSDAALANLLGSNSQNIWNRRNRNSVPYREAVFVSLWAKVSLDYLLTGRGKL
jgi:hypothetical protein